MPEVEEAQHQNHLKRDLLGGSNESLPTLGATFCGRDSGFPDSPPPGDPSSNGEGGPTDKGLSLEFITTVVAINAFLDGLNLSSSVSRYTFDILNDDNLSLHDFVMTPEGIIITTLQTLFLISASVLGSIEPYFEESTAFHRFFSSIWPHIRNTLKATKNAYKGMRSTLVLLTLFTAKDLRFLVIPVGLALGILSAINRALMHVLSEARTAKIATNTALQTTMQQVSEEECALLEVAVIPDDTVLQEHFKNSYVLLHSAEGDELYYIDANGVKRKLDILPTAYQRMANYPTLSRHQSLLLALKSAHYSRLCESIEKESTFSMVAGYTTTFAGASFDGLYLYMGAAIITILIPSMLWMTSIFSLTCVLLCVATRLYEEYLRQQKLAISVEATLLAHEEAELHTTLTELFTCLINYHREADQIEKERLAARYREIFATLPEKEAAFREHRDALKAEKMPSWNKAILQGLANGLAVYGAIVSFMFSASTVCLLLGVAFPAELVIATVFIGMACIIGSLAYSLIQFPAQLATWQAHLNNNLNLRQHLSEDIQTPSSTGPSDEPPIVTADRQKTNIKEAVSQCFAIKDIDKDTLPDAAEVFRSGGSSIAKNIKGMQYAMEPFANEGSPEALVAMATTAPIYFGVFTAAAYISRFERDKKPRRNSGSKATANTRTGQGRSASARNFHSRTQSPIPPYRRCKTLPELLEQYGTDSNRGNGGSASNNSQPPQPPTTSTHPIQHSSLRDLSIYDVRNDDSHRSEEHKTGHNSSRGTSVSQNEESHDDSFFLPTEHQRRHNSSPDDWAQFETLTPNSRKLTSDNLVQPLTGTPNSIFQPVEGNSDNTSPVIDTVSHSSSTISMSPSD